MFPSTVHRVPANTCSAVNASIRATTRANVARFQGASPEAIQRRLDELDREWDIERRLETNAASIVIAGVALGVFVDRRWLALPAVVGGFLLQHAVQGWCPPLPIMRRFGVRTASEIDHERYALKALRGDFQEIQPANAGIAPVASADALRAAEL